MLRSPGSRISKRATRAIPWRARYPRIYEETARAHERNFSLSGVETRPSSLGDIRKRVDVVFTYTHRQTNVEEKQSTLVDVQELNPFVVRPLSPNFPR